MSIFGRSQTLLNCHARRQSTSLQRESQLGKVIWRAWSVCQLTGCLAHCFSVFSPSLNFGLRHPWNPWIVLWILNQMFSTNPSGRKSDRQLMVRGTCSPVGTTFFFVWHMPQIIGFISFAQHSVLLPLQHHPLTERHRHPSLPGLGICSSLHWLFTLEPFSEYKLISKLVTCWGTLVEG